MANISARCIQWMASVGWRAQRGTALAEYTLVLPMIVLVLALSLQMALVIIQYYSAMHITRETARWLSINPDTIDSGVLTQANSLRANLPGVHNHAFTSTQVVVSPTCTALVSGKCTGRDAGTSLSVTITPSVSNVLFFPSTYNIFGWTFQFPTSMPAYRVTAMVE